MASISTVPELKRALRQAREVVVLPRFGCSETWVRISKADAAVLVGKLGGKDTTPEQAEMYSGDFGLLDNGTLYLG
jgi:hypothetical protein